MNQKKIGLAVWASLSLVSLSACAGRPFIATKYRPEGMLGGYAETQVSAGIWQVTGRSIGIAERGFGRNMAAYRAAELMKARGFSYLQILDQDGKATQFSMGGGSMYDSGETMTLRSANDAAAPTDCRSANPNFCSTLAIEPLMAKLAPSLYIEPAEIVAE